MINNLPGAAMDSFFVDHCPSSTSCEEPGWSPTAQKKSQAGAWRSRRGQAGAWRSWMFLPRTIDILPNCCTAPWPIFRNLDQIRFHRIVLNICLYIPIMTLVSDETIPILPLPYSPLILPITGFFLLGSPVYSPAFCPGSPGAGLAILGPPGYSLAFLSPCKNHYPISETVGTSIPSEPPIRLLRVTGGSERPDSSPAVPG